MGQSSKEELMSVKLDWTFKELMLKEEIRNSFISAVLGKKIKSSTVLNPFLRKDYEDEARQKAIRDYNHLMYQSKQEGIKEGAYKKAIETARKLLLKGFNIEEVIELTDLTLEQIESLKSDI